MKPLICQSSDKGFVKNPNLTHCRKPLKDILSLLSCVFGAFFVSVRKIDLIRLPNRGMNAFAMGCYPADPRLYIIVVFLFLLIMPGIAVGNPLSDIKSLLGHRDGMLLISPQDNVIFTWNADQPLIPASTLKILTALVAFHHLGPDYRFTTDVYMDNAFNLKIKGYGDPMLISEVLTEMTQEIVESRLKSPFIINDIILDNSFFSHPLTIPGITSSLNPFDAPNGALCANFNTVNFTQDEKGRYISAEPQTPLLPFVLNRIRSSGMKSGRIVLSNNADETARYAGHLLKFFLTEKGVKITGRIQMGVIEEKSDPLLFHYTSQYTLANLISRLMEYSNNFIANQILIATGAKVYGAPGSLDKGVKAASVYAETVLGIKDIRLVEGSGISRENSISPDDMSRILGEFTPYHHLMEKTGNAFYKTGTLNGIRTRAGYIENDRGELYRFVVFINTPGTPVDTIMEKLFELAGREN